MVRGGRHDRCALGVKLDAAAAKSWRSHGVAVASYLDDIVVYRRGGHM